MHVDGFRFDLASVMSRDPNGELLKEPPVLWGDRVGSDLAGTKIIAEAWDAGGLYQVGSFTGHRWAGVEQPVPRRCRRFVCGEGDTVQRLSQRVTGSRDLYHQPARDPSRSVNFITCHDGFTINDLCSYAHKHNEDNGGRTATARMTTTAPTTASRTDPRMPPSRRCGCAR